MVGLTFHMQKNKIADADLQHLEEEKQHWKKKLEEL